MPKFRSQAGFTLLELVIVVGIIAIFVAISMVFLSESRSESRNAAVLAQMAEYEKALNLYYSDNGTFPVPSIGPASREYCLGSGSSGAHGCWNGVDGPDAYLAAALVPDYMPNLPGFNQGPLGSPAYNSCIGGTFNNNTSCTIHNFSMFFLLEGTNQDCGRYFYADGGYQSSVGDYTLCRMNLDAING